VQCDRHVAQEAAKSLVNLVTTTPGAHAEQFIQHDPQAASVARSCPEFVKQTVKLILFNGHNWGTPQATVALFERAAAILAGLQYWVYSALPATSFS
jgi:hypothetical protein